MPQKVITNQIALQPALDASQEAVPVESYADRLMDELFEDVDRVLDEETALPVQPVQPEVVSLQPIAVPQIILPPGMMPRPKERTDEEAIARQVALAAKKLESSRSFDRILLGAAFASLVLTLGLWVASRGGFGRSETAISESQVAAQAKSQADATFASYLQQVFDTTEQKKTASAQQPSPSLPPATASTDLPKLLIPGGPPANAGIAQAINRVADALEQQAAKPGQTIPPTQVVIVPPTGSGVAPAAAGVASTRGSGTAPSPGVKAPTAPNATTKAPAATSPAAKAPAPAPAAAPAPAVTAPAPVGPINILPREALPTPPAVSEPAPARAETPTAAATSPSSSLAHTLVGILELGDRSAALFEIDGVARRIYVGESIGASGWTLAEVKNQEAVIRKGGEIRSIFVGQKF